ncbi:MAG: BTAD domain-containing putative transcriptional regulator, partial [Streptosporangiaceae bacterium]
MRDNGYVAVRVRLLGPFSVVSGGRAAGPWPRPSAGRLCQLVLVSPGRRVSRDLVCEELFGDLDPRAAARSVSKALSMARAALAGLGEPGQPSEPGEPSEPAPALLEADLTHIWASPAVEVDAAEHERALRAALAMGPGHERDGLLATTLADDGELLADEPYADWALRPRERLEALRQEARLALARDRVKGAGDSRAEAVLAAWAACAEHDPASEEAAAALVRGYFAEGHRELAVRAYERCRAALGELGLGLSPWLEEVYATAAFEAGPPRTQAPAREELRTVSVLAAEVAAAGLADPEELRDVTGRGLAAVIAEVEALGGSVTSVSGTGLQAVFGAPAAHEDDPERATRAAFRALTAVAAHTVNGSGRG